MKKKSQELVVSEQGLSQISEIDRMANEYLTTLGFNLRDKDVKVFREICRAYQLTPFKREIYGIKGWEDGSEVLTIIVGYEVYLKRAERTDKLDGWEKELAFDDNGNIISSTVIIHRKDRTYPLKHTVYFKEFARYKKEKDGKLTLMKNWRQMPIFMLEKVATAQAFRLAFPDELGGLPYIEEEVYGMQEVKEVILSKPAVEMPKAKILQDTTIQPNDDVNFFETITEQIDSSLNIDELENIWKKEYKHIKKLPENLLAKITEIKDLKKQELTIPLTQEA